MGEKKRTTPRTPFGHPWSGGGAEGVRAPRPTARMQIKPSPHPEPLRVQVWPSPPPPPRRAYTPGAKVRGASVYRGVRLRHPSGAHGASTTKYPPRPSLQSPFFCQAGNRHEVTVPPLFHHKSVPPYSRSSAPVVSIPFKHSCYFRALSIDTACNFCLRVQTTLNSWTCSVGIPGIGSMHRKNKRAQRKKPAVKVTAPLRGGGLQGGRGVNTPPQTTTPSNLPAPPQPLNPPPPPPNIEKLTPPPPRTPLPFHSIPRAEGPCAPCRAAPLLCCSTHRRAGCHSASPIETYRTAPPLRRYGPADGLGGLSQSVGRARASHKKWSEVRTRAAVLTCA